MPLDLYRSLYGLLRPGSGGRCQRGVHAFMATYCIVYAQMKVHLLLNDV